jgi:hypothetical protein
MRTNVFRDENNILCVRKLSLPERDYELYARRYLEDGGKSLKIVALYRSLKGDNKEVEAISYFEKVGPSPNPLPGMSYSTT